MTDSNSLLIESLYTQDTLMKVLTDYTRKLKATGNFNDMAHSIKLLEYQKLITNKKFLQKLRRHFNDLYRLINDKHPNTLFNIIGRRKALISLDKKINKLMNDGKSLDWLRDMYGIRIVLFDSTMASISTCYKICLDVIEYFSQEGFTLCEAETLSGTENFNPEEYPDILLPKKSLVPKQYRFGVKDYILTPKNKGYQSLHIVFRAQTGECFEVQIRTLNMDIHAEFGDASHGKYKEEKYRDQILNNLDRTKIKIDGYGVYGNSVIDYVGIEKGLQILQRQKTF